MNFYKKQNTIFAVSKTKHGFMHAYKAQIVTSPHGGTGKINWFHKYGEESDIKAWDEATDKYSDPKYYHYRPIALNAMNIFSHPCMHIIYNHNFENGYYFNVYYSHPDRLFFIKGVMRDKPELAESESMIGLSTPVGRRKDTFFVYIIDIETAMKKDVLGNIGDITIKVSDLLEKIPPRLNTAIKHKDVFPYSIHYDKCVISSIRYTPYAGECAVGLEKYNYKVWFNRDNSRLTEGQDSIITLDNIVSLLQFYQPGMPYLSTFMLDRDDFMGERLKSYEIVLKYDKKVEPYSYQQVIVEPNSIAIYADTNYGLKLYVQRFNELTDLHFTLLRAYYDPIAKYTGGAVSLFDIRQFQEFKNN